MGTTALYTPQPVIFDPIIGGMAGGAAPTLPGDDWMNRTAPELISPGQLIERYGRLQERFDASQDPDFHLNYDVVGSSRRTILGDAHHIDLFPL